MSKAHYSITINAPVDKVWHAMLDDKTYREWTATFMPGSFFKGSWIEGSKIQFLAKDENGKLGGMTSVVAKLTPNEFVSIHHLGTVNNDVEDTTSEEAKKWNGFENYTFRTVDGGTEVVVDVDIADEMKEFFDEAWPKALNTLKEISEK